MNILKSSPTGHLKGIKHTFHKPSPQQEITFNQLKGLFQKFEDKFHVTNKPVWNYELWTMWGYRTKSNHPQNVKSVLFASLTVYEKHISLYFYPIYLDKTLSKRLSEDLTPYLTGKSTFHIVDLTAGIKLALSDLIKNGIESYKHLNLIP
jgi:hypothetical protein